MYNTHPNFVDGQAVFRGQKFNVITSWRWIIRSFTGHLLPYSTGYCNLKHYTWMVEVFANTTIYGFEVLFRRRFWRRFSSKFFVPMYNAHPIFQDNKLVKFCALYTENYGTNIIFLNFALNLTSLCYSPLLFIVNMLLLIWSTSSL